MKNFYEATSSLSKSLILFLVLAFLYMAWNANTDLTVGRFALFMDERITFDGVKNILHPDGVQHFLWSIFNGGDQRYGRSLWNSVALVSVLPERIWGETGQIIASRTLQAFLILSSALIFAIGLLRNWCLRLILIAAFLAAPYSDYFSTIPKPEPLQLLFLSLFSCFYIRKNLNFGWYWIFAGLAFGLKISTLPLLAVFGIFSLLAHRHDLMKKGFSESIKVACYSFLIGLGISVPILLIPVGVLIFIEYCISRQLSCRVSNAYVLLAIRLLGVVLAYVLSARFLKSWFGSTFLNTAHGEDQSSINFFSWINYFLNEWLVAPPTLGVACLTSIMLLIAVFAFTARSSSKFNPLKMGALAIAISGLLLNASIFFGVHRLWGMYLFPGTVMLLSGIMLIAENSFLSCSAGRACKLLKGLAFLVVSQVIFITTLYWAPQAYTNYKNLSLRTQTDEFINQYSSYKEINEFIGLYQKQMSRPIRIAYSPSLFIPQSNKEILIQEFWGNYVRWTDQPDLIVLQLNNTPRGTPRPVDSPEYPAFLIERNGYALHVVEQGKVCSAVPCFERQIILPNGGEILTLKK